MIRLAPFLLLSLVACGEDKKDARSAAAQAELIAELVPADAQVILRVESANAATELAAASGRTMQDPLGMLGMILGVSTAGIDRTKPAVVALTFKQSSPRPEAVLILPFPNPGKVAEAHQGGKKTKGKYAALANTPELPELGSALARGMPGGDVSLRADCKAIVAHYKPLIEQMLGLAEAQAKLAQQPDQPDMSGIFESYMNGVRNVLYGTQSIDLSFVRSEGGGISADAVFTADPEGPLDLTPAEPSKLRAMAAHLPDGQPMYLLARFDWSAYMKQFEAMYDSIVAAAPEAEQPELRAYMKKMTATMEKLGKNAALSVDLQPAGLRMVMAMESPDPAGYLEEYVTLLRAPAATKLGMTFKPEATRKIGETKVHRYLLTMDPALIGEMAGAPDGAEEHLMKRLLGDDGMRTEMAALNDRVVFAMGGDDALMDNAVAGKKVPASLEPALKRVPGELQAAFYCDIRALARPFVAIMAELGGTTPKLKEGGPVPLLFAAGTGKGKLYVGLDIDWTEISELFE
ncbi:MAG: hypothetical protein ACYTHK_18470 [Planctomycetota bacterium]|jgi:hypothetical protein